METIVLETDNDRHYRESVSLHQKEGYKVVFADIKEFTYRAIMVKDRQEVEYKRINPDTRLEETVKGYFHGWAEETIEGSEASNNLRFTMGIIEEEDGTIVTVTPSNIKFIRS